MSIQDLGLFQGLSAKMDYLNKRQSVFSQNIANSDTPGYRPQDLKKVDFGVFLNNVTGESKVKVETTNPLHMPNPKAEINDKAEKKKDMYEVAPAGNSVIVEEQLINASQNMMDYSLMLNIYQKQIGMFRVALGR